MTTAPLFARMMESTARVIVNQGGTSSGKTYTTLQVLFALCAEKTRTATVVAADVPNLKAGAFRDAQTIWASDEVLRKFYPTINKGDREFRGVNGAIIEFKSYADAQDAKSGKRDLLFVNEADGITYDVYWQLAIRTKERVFIDYNPTSRFWVHDNVIGGEGVQLIISDHRSNPFLSADQHARIESIDDEELFRVYARGKTGQIRGLVFKDWEIVDEMPESLKKDGRGIDFGFTNDPTAIVRAGLAHGYLYADLEAYDTGLDNPTIARHLRAQGCNIYSPIVADSAEPKSIAEINAFGLHVRPTTKGADSIRNGLQILTRYPLRVTRRSKGLIRELKAYKWKQGRDGEQLNEPVDAFNHAIDALRYYALSFLAEKRPTHYRAGRGLIDDRFGV